MALAHSEEIKNNDVTVIKAAVTLFFKEDRNEALKAMLGAEDARKYVDIAKRIKILQKDNPPRRELGGNSLVADYLVKIKSDYNDDELAVLRKILKDEKRADSKKMISYLLVASCSRDSEFRTKILSQLPLWLLSHPNLKEEKVKLGVEN